MRIESLISTLNILVGSMSIVRNHNLLSHVKHKHNARDIDKAMICHGYKDYGASSYSYSHFFQPASSITYATASLENSSMCVKLNSGEMSIRLQRYYE